jgi:four helix bundle protein
MSTVLAYSDWLESVPDVLKQDSLWRVEAYRLSLYLSDCAWLDADTVARKRLARVYAHQLVRAVGSISANVAEGYSRRTGRERSQFYQYALGSAREGRDWYFKLRHVLDPETIAARLDPCTQVVRLLLMMASDQRSAPPSVRDEEAGYST